MPWQSDTLWQLFFFKSKADAVMPRIGQFIQPRDHSKGKQDGGICSHGNAVVPLLYLIKRGPADTGPFGHECSRNTPSQSCGADIASQLSEGAGHRYGCR